MDSFSQRPLKREESDVSPEADAPIFLARFREQAENDGEQHREADVEPYHHSCRQRDGLRCFVRVNFVDDGTCIAIARSLKS